VFLLRQVKDFTQNCGKHIKNNYIGDIVKCLKIVNKNYQHQCNVFI